MNGNTGNVFNFWEDHQFRSPGVNGQFDKEKSIGTNVSDISFDEAPNDDSSAVLFPNSSSVSLHTSNVI